MITVKFEILFDSYTANVRAVSFTYTVDSFENAIAGANLQIKMQPFASDIQEIRQITITKVRG